jgi:hypothetical protein
VLGLTPSGRELVQIYWTMGRSLNSKNRVMIRDGENIKTVPHDSSLEVKQESLLMYNAAMRAGGTHVVSNGRQTDTVAEYLAKGDGFEDALYRWEYEDDAPIYTSRITGISTGGENKSYKLSIIKALGQKPELLSHQFFSYAAALPGLGHCIHTYSLTQVCAPFSGEPYWVNLLDDPDANADFYWNLLPEDKRVALYVKHIDVASGAIRDRICNIHTAAQG